MSEDGEIVISRKKSKRRSYREGIAAGRQSFIEPEAKTILTGAGDISVIRTDEDVEEIFGFKPKSHYKIIDQSGRNILVAAEKVNSCKHLPASVRPFEIKILDPKNELFMLMKRPCVLRYLWPPWNILHQRALVYFPPDTYLGKIVQTCGFISPKFQIYDTHDTVLYKINIIEDENSVWEIWSSNAKFQVQDKNNKTVGRIIKSKGKVRTETKGFKVGFLKSLDLNVKALIVASSFLIECMYFGKG